MTSERGHGADQGKTHFSVTVKNSLDPESPPKHYKTWVRPRGILIGGLNHLQDSGVGFTFTSIQDPDYGPFLQSVNHLAGDRDKHTYWRLEVKRNGEIKPLDVGIGCFIPEENDEILLIFSKY